MTSRRELIRRRTGRLRSWLVLYAGMVAVVAVVAGIVWNRLVRLPSYEIGDDYRAQMRESDLSQIVAVDVVFALIGIVVGLLVGAMAWILFARLEVGATIIAFLGSLFAGLSTRLVGEFIGPRSFEERIANATNGDLVQINFTAHTWVSLSLWVAAGVLPVLIGGLIQRQGWIPYVRPSGETGETPVESPE